MVLVVSKVRHSWFQTNPQPNPSRPKNVPTVQGSDQKFIQQTNTSKIMKTILSFLTLAALSTSAFSGEACKKCCADKGKSCAECCKDAGKTCGKECCKEKK